MLALCGFYVVIADNFTTLHMDVLTPIYSYLLIISDIFVVL